MLIELDLLALQNHLRVKKEAGKTWLYDPLRRKWLVMQPEELVRQLIIHYLIEVKGYNPTRIKVEKGLTVNDLYKRCDVLVYDRQVQPFLLIECKAPQVAVTQEVFRQIATYNLPLQVPYLLVTNGMKTYCCAMDYEERTYTYLAEAPAYPEGEGSGSAKSFNGC